MYRLFFFILASWFVFSGCGSTEHNRPKVILKFGHQANESDIWHQSAVYFAQRVDSLSQGSIEVRVFPSEQLGRELDIIRSIEAGIDDMTITGESMQNWSEITGFCGMPYLIKDFNHIEQVLSGAVGDAIEKEMIKKIGLRPLAYFARGPRHLTSNRPIRSPGDLKGMILRVPPVPVSVKTWEALGAKPTPMSFSEVFTALQQGTVEGQENPFALIYSGGLYEVQKYLNLTGHVIGWVYVVIGEKQFQALKPEHREIVVQAGKEAQEYHARLFENQEDELRKKLIEQGMTFIEVDQEAFRKKASEAVMQSISPSLRLYYEKIANQLPNDAKGD